MTRAPGHMADSHLENPVKLSSEPIHIDTLYIDMIFAFYGNIFHTHLYCLVGCLSMILWTHAVLSGLYACVLYFVFELAQRN